MNDLKFAIRQLRKSPGFTAVAVITLALGIGANTAIFSFINGLVLRPLPYPSPERLVTLWERNPRRGIEQDRVSGPNYLDWREQNTVFADLAATPAWEGIEDFNLVLRDGAAKIRAGYTAASLFTTLGMPPLLGRTFFPEEDRKGGSRVAVLGYDLWKRHFDGDSNVLGRTLTVDTYGRREYTIVGVMPPGFGLPGRCELWLPLGWMGVSLTERRSAHWHNIIGRLKPGVTLEQARTEMNMIQARLSQAHPGETIGSEVAVVPMLHQALGSNFRTALFVLWGVVAGVLLIACANVANLMLARAAGRQKEIALRLALGAGRWRVIRQLLLESILLALLGGTAGVLLAWGSVNVLVASSPIHIPRLAEVRLDGQTLAYTLGISLLTGTLFGLAPAWQFTRPALNQALKDDSPFAAGGRSTSHTRNLLVIVEVAVSVVLLAGAGLMLQSFARMLRAERGFAAEHLLTADLDFSVSGFTGWTRPTATRPQVSLKTLIERVRTWPGVQAVGAGSRLIRRENRPPNEVIAIFGRPTLKPEEQRRAEFKGVTPEWVRALGARLLRGRDISEADTLQGMGAVLINETLARRYFPNEDPIGQHLRMGAGQPPLQATNRWGSSEWSEIVGVISDVKSLHPQPEAVPEVYQAYWQWPMQSPTLLVRATGDPVALAENLRRETKLLIPNVPTPLIRSMDTLMTETMAQPRLQTGLLSLFAALALGLAAVGLYGVLGYTVTQRQREIGLRMALGARRHDVLRLVVGQGMRLALVGIACGWLGAFGLTRLLRTLLFEIKPNDPLTFAAVPLLLLAVTILACWLPARRAAQVEPMQALRTE